RPPGREAYPGDIFYAHSRLLERSVKMANRWVIVPADADDKKVAADWGVTNDKDEKRGHGEKGKVYSGPLEKEHAEKVLKNIAGGLRLDLAAFRELEAFAQLGTDLDRATQQQLDRGYRMVEILKQPQFQPMDVVDQVMIIYAGIRGHLDKVPAKQVQAWEKQFLRYMNDHQAPVKA